MLISDGKGSWIRQTKSCQFKRNGSFIDVHFLDDGRKRWIALTRKDLEAFLKSGNKEGEGLIEFNEPLDESTLLRDLLSRSSVVELGHED